MGNQAALINFLGQPGPQAQAAQHQLAQNNAFQAVKNAQANKRLDLAAQKQQAAQAAAPAKLAQEQSRLNQAQSRIAGDVAREQRLQRGQQAGAVSSLAGSVGEGAASIGERVTAWAENVPTPGGIGVLLLLIFLLLWMVIPVNGGKTRLQLLWLTFTGRTKMAATPDAGGTFNPSAGSGGTGSGGVGSGGPAPSSNGHSMTDTSSLLANIGVRDWSQS